ncbi:MAG TPA: tetratricopeptide repeat protein [Blastocatellia bacterium]|nr:tetratricopeptide repeat protein [Blastocatellia bacterium]
MKKYAAKAFHPDAADLNHEAYKSGCALFRAGNYHKAKLAFEEALRYWPKDPQAWMALGNCHDELNKPKAAEKCFRRALEYCEVKDQDAIRYNLANSLLDQERLEAAIEFYEKIPAESDLYAPAQRNLSLARSFIQDNND